MKAKNVCPKCFSREIIANVKVLDRIEGNVDHALAIRITPNPGALVLGTVDDFPFEVYVCGKCGYSEFYQPKPEEFAEAWRNSRTDDESES